MFPRRARRSPAAKAGKGGQTKARKKRSGARRRDGRRTEDRAETKATATTAAKHREGRTGRADAAPKQGRPPQTPKGRADEDTGERFPRRARNAPQSVFFFT